MEEYSYGERNRRRNILLVSVILFFLITFIGTMGYRYLFDMTWLDAIYSAVLVLSTLSVEGRIGTPIQKIFIMIYSLIAGVIYITIATYSIETILEIYEEGKHKNF